MAESNFLKDNQNLIIGAVALYFGYTKILKPLSETFGLSKSEDEKNVNTETNKLDSPFNPNFWKTIPNATIIKTDAVNKFAETIWNSVGWFNDDFDAVLGVFKSLKTKTQVSYLVYKFNQLYKKDLLNWLLGTTYPSDRYSAEQVNQIINLVKNYKRS
jgi:hypothetical protein